MFGIHDCAPPSPTREETLQAERDAASGALADAVRKARDVALEEAAKECESMEANRWTGWPKCCAERIRALKSRP